MEIHPMRKYECSNQSQTIREETAVFVGEKYAS